MYRLSWCRNTLVVAPGRKIACHGAHTSVARNARDGIGPSLIFFTISGSRIKGRQKYSSKENPHFKTKLKEAMNNLIDP
jgi:hypothetical protein